MKSIVLTSMPGPRLTAKWNAFVTHAPFATHYVTPNYFTDPYVRGNRFAALAIDDKDDVAAVTTGVFDKEKITSGLFSRPQMVFRGNIDKHAAVKTLITGVDEISDDQQSVELYSWEKSAAFSDQNLKMCASNDETSVVVIDLAAGTDAIFANFSQTRRNELRKAMRDELVEIKEIETESELAALYEIYCEWNIRKGNFSDTFERMQTAFRQRENRRLFIAKTDSKVIAGSFYRFAPGGVVEYAANFSTPEYQKLKPNDLLGWHAIQWACEEGFSHFSMGGSHLFLRRFGGEIITTYRYKRNGKFRLANVHERTREFGIQSYRRLPANVRQGVRKVLAG